jgi:uncharacterized protein YyaL (SSP411 family)
VASMANRLASETSPYLLQHADNPVDWYPWGPEALSAARETRKPILLSIGYSACHWCHVMAHESFEDADTAAVMNQLFINIKVDREERPDLDKIYQTAHQLLTQRAGGWPLTMFLTAEQQWPFFGGTYFPRDARYGMPAFKEVLQRAAEYYDAHAAEVARQGDAFAQAFARLEPPGNREELDATPLAFARETLAEQFDERFGGFGNAPKFPSSTNIERLLRHWRAGAGGPKPDLDALYMATLTLTRMAQGGLYDQLGGGFFRYSVDQFWLIPHFEKMLYDNALLLSVYAQAHAATGEPLFARSAAETAAWLSRDMQDSGGAFYATLDADSEGEEGRFYLWQPGQVRDLLPGQQAALLERHLGLGKPPNFEDKDWHLFVAEPLDEVAADLSLTPEAAQATLDEARTTLLEARRQRVWPGRDEKILTGWNGLVIGALATAGRTLHDPTLIDHAAAAADFVRRRLWSDAGLTACYKDGQARFQAYLDDYAFLAAGLLELLQCRWNNEEFAWLLALVERLLADFEDTGKGGFFFTAHDHEQLIHRPKSFSDDATPAGNGVTAGLLIQLGYLLGESRYLEAAQRTLAAAWQPLAEYPHAHGTLLNALESLLRPPDVIVIRGDRPDAPWQRLAQAGFNPQRLVFSIPADATDLPGALAERCAGDGTMAYVCRGHVCSPPVTRLEELAAALAEPSAAG